MKVVENFVAFDNRMELTLADHSFVGNEIVVEALDDAQEGADGSSLVMVAAPVEFAFDIGLVVN